MLVCVPVTMDGQLDPRWGRAARVAIADVRGGSILSWHEVDVAWDRLHDETTEGGHHARVARFLRDSQVETVIAHHMGGEMANMLERMGIRIHLGVGGDARQAAISAPGLAAAAAEESRDAHRRRWDERHRERDIESPEPNPIVVAEASKLSPGAALDVACGVGTNAVWLASRGWQVTGVDWSRVALEKAQAKADAAGVTVRWVEADLLHWSPPNAAFDLVTIAYLHLPPEERRTAYAAAARAVAPGGRLLVVGHDRINLTEGVGGPQDPERLFTAEELSSELTDADAALLVERAEVVRRLPSPERGPIDALLVIRRRDAALG